MTELADVRDLIMAFEQHNTVALTFRFALEMTGKAPDVVVTAEAHQNRSAIGEAPALASVSVKCSVMNLKTWNAVLTHVMYALDFQLALNELASAEPKRA